ncbi:hypothetical protein WMF04_27660 [Sorangium sp. So ce260]|uniref:hypothetical protein n=1 Tax=Sorangium sp. So ce260 TaxID=3133291 RepID=UPI003F5FF52A
MTSFPALARLAALVSLVAAARPAAAASGEQTASLSWVRLGGAEACVGARALAQAVEARLGRAALVSAARADLTIEGRIAPGDGGGWRAVIAVADAGGALLGTREIATPSRRCDAIDDDLALAIALMIDPDARLSPGPPPPAPPAPPAPPPAPPPQVVVQRILIPASPPAPRAPPAPWRLEIGAGPLFGLGLLPAPGVAATIRARVTPPGFWSFEVGGAVWAPNEATAGALATRFSWGEGFVSACPVSLGDETQLSACAGVRLGAMSTGSFGFDVNLAEDRITAGGALDVRLARRLLGPLTAGIGLGLVVPLVRDTFYYTDTQGQDRQVFRMAPLGGTADILLGVRFP